MVMVMVMDTAMATAKDTTRSSAGCQDGRKLEGSSKEEGKSNGQTGNCVLLTVYC